VFGIFVGVTARKGFDRRPEMRARIVSVAVGLWLCAASVFAQQGTATIGGKVADQGGGLLPGVTIVITNEDSGIIREVITNVDGSYFASQINPGRYRVSAKLEGFKALERQGILLEVGRTTTLDLTLEVGGLEETVTVTAAAALVDTTSAQLGGHISSAEINELPQTTRSYMALVGNVPGAQFVQGGGFLNDTMLANGQPAAANAINIDGASNVDDQRGSNVGGQVRTANETLQEVQVMTSQFDAEFGRTSGAVVNAVTKSGTNKLSGSVFQFFRKERDGEELLCQGEQPAEARHRQDGVGRHLRRPDRSEQVVLLHQSRTRDAEEAARRRIPDAAGAQLFDRRCRRRVEHVCPIRPSADEEPHLGGPLAARDCPATAGRRAATRSVEDRQ
jgi:hypothetical protein